MTYEFIADDGTIIEENHPMASAPDEVTREGKLYRRVAFSPSNRVFFADAQVATMTDGYPRTDVTVPRGTDFGYGTDPKGHPIIKSATHEREVCKRHGFWRD